MSNLKEDNTYGAIERRLRDEEFNVLHLHRDGRGDWGDDGGFIIAVCEKHEQMYVHILEVNYNMEVGCLVLEEGDDRLNEENYIEIRDFIKVGNVEEAQLEVNKFLCYLETAIKMEEDGESDGLGDIREEWDEYPEFLQFLNPDAKYYLSMLSRVYFAYSERYGDKEKLELLTETPYVPDYRCDYAVQEEEYGS